MGPSPMPQVAGIVVPLLFWIMTLQLDSGGGVITLPLEKRKLPAVFAVAPSGMTKSGGRAKGVTVVDGVSTAVSKVVPPSIDGSHHPEMTPPATGRNVPVPVMSQMEPIKAWSSSFD